MALRFFVVPVHDSSVFEQELNGFLAGHKVVSIQRQRIDQGGYVLGHISRRFDFWPQWP